MKNKLIIISGPSGVGKSAVSAKLHDLISQSFLMDRDVQSRFFGKDRDTSTGIVTAEMLLEMTKVILQNNRDVIFDWNMRSIEYRDTLKKIAAETNSEYVEIILFASKEVVVKRCDDRGYKPDLSFSREKCERFWEDINKLIKIRKEATVVMTDNLTQEEVFEKIKEEIK